MKTKYCKHCQKDKPIDKFSKGKHGEDNLQFYCKECNAELNKQYREGNLQSVKLQQAKWYKENRERINIKKTKYRDGALGRYCQIKVRAKKRNIEFLISKGEFTDWFTTRIGLCHYCGRELSKYRNGSLRGLTIDRRDNDRPYEMSNLVLACSRCNLMKGSWLTEEQMIDAAERYLRS